MPEGNGKENPEESYTNKYHKNIACSHGYKLECVDDKFSKPFKILLIVLYSKYKVNIVIYYEVNIAVTW